MTDCQNAEIRDQLPDLLHDRLSAGERAAVLAHVDGCAECRDELELLRGVRRALVTTTPRIDTALIVSALPKPGASVVIPLRAKRSRWADWRVAATITVLAAGGSSVALLSRARATVPPVVIAPDRPTDTAQASIPAPPPSNAVAPDKVAREAAAKTVAEAETASVADQPEIGMEGRLNGLSEQQLRSLLDDIGQMKAVPITEPEPAVINVNARSSSSGDGGVDWR